MNATSGQFIGFRISNADKMRLISNGNFGIGTITPSEKLDVAGNVNITGNLNVTGNITNSAPSIIAMACTNSSGTILRGVGLTCSRLSTGKYKYTLAVARSTVNYVVHSTVMEGSNRDDIVAYVSANGSEDKTTSYFVIIINEQDNSTTAGTQRDREHMVSVIDF